MYNIKRHPNAKKKLVEEQKRKRRTTKERGRNSKLQFLGGFEKCKFQNIQKQLKNQTNIA